MRPILKTTVVAAILAISNLLAVAPQKAKAHSPPAYYYSAPGYYATTEGTVYIPAAGYYYNVPAYVHTPRFVSSPIWGPASYRIPVRGRGGIRFISDPTPPAMLSPVPSYRPTDPW